MHVSADNHGSQKKVSNSLGLELQEDLGFLMWVLGIELGTVLYKSALDCQTSL